MPTRRSGTQLYSSVACWRALSCSGRARGMELDLRANEPIEVVATHAGQTVHFSLESQPDVAPERVLWVPSAAADTGRGVELELYGRGQLLHQDSLRALREERSE